MPAPSDSPAPIRLSVVVPFYNEEESAADVLAELVSVLNETGPSPWEAIAVDDGSTDSTAEALARFAEEEPRVRVLRFKANAGQTAALDAGFRAARGLLVGMMDGDGQNDPRDFSRLAAAQEETGADMVCGVRAKRRDSVVRRISSRVANGTRNRLTRESIADVGCSMRVFRRECLDGLKLYNGMHRFLPTLVRIEGRTIAELPVNHRPREKGRSKYGINNRLWSGLRDIFAVRWMQRRALRYEIVDDPAQGTAPDKKG